MRTIFFPELFFSLSSVQKVSKTRKYQGLLMVSTTSWPAVNSPDDSQTAKLTSYWETGRDGAIDESTWFQRSNPKSVAVVFAQTLSTAL
jgi:hypothetical protein